MEKEHYSYFRKHFFSIATILFFVFVHTAMAQENISFRHLTTANGLTSNITQSVFQDSRGLMWISTHDGLNMYDGQTVKQFYLSDFEPVQTYNNNLGDIVEDKDHNILVSEKSGVAKFNWASKQFSIAYKSQFASYGNVFPGLFIDAHKNIWVNERIFIKEFDPDFKLMHTWKLHEDAGMFLTGPTNTFIIGEDNMDNIWINDFNSVLCINSKNKQLRVINKSLEAINPRYKSFDCLSVSDSLTWLIAYDFTVLCINSNYKLVHEYELPHNIYPSYKQVILRDGKVWIGTHDNGIFVFDEKTGILLHNLKASESNETGTLVSNNISGMMKDKDGNIWVTTNAGINEIPVNTSLFYQSNFTLPVSSTGPLNIHNMFSMNDAIFVFTSSGIIEWHQSNDRKQYFIDNKNYYTTGFPLDDKWLVSTSHGIGFWKIKDNRIIHIPYILPHPSILDTTGAAAFYKDKYGDIWIGLLNDAGIICWHTTDNSFNYYSQKGKGKNYCPLRHFKYVLEDRVGNLWMGYEKGGIAIFDKQQQRFIIPEAFEKNAISNISVFGMINDQKHHFWIATNTGLIKYDETTNTYRLFTRKDGLPSNNILSIAQDATGNIWIGFEGALSSLNIASNKIVNYSNTDGLPDKLLQNSLYAPGLKNMFFSSDSNVVYFNPQKVKKVTPSLYPVITSFQVMGKEQPVYSKIELSYSQNYLSFHFSAPNYINATDNEYECKLDGADHNWVFLGGTHFANYSQLSPGKYTFHVRARIKNGNWQRVSEPVNVSILTPFWRTTWFLVLCSLAFLSVVFLFIYIRLRNKLEKQLLAQSIRDKISRDLHDDIGSTLSSISILSELAKQKYPGPNPLLERITENTHLIQENMNDIVWAINPTNDRFGNIIQHMSLFAAEVLEAKNMQLQFNSDDTLATIVLPMEKRKNFYLLFKEAINNCAKYSGASKVSISVSKSDHQIKLVIEDDGKGFNIEGQYGGNGMRTMKNRAALLEGILQINSENGKGTIIQLRFKV